MEQVIIHTNENGNVTLTIPTGELSIEEVLAKDCPIGAIIVNNSELPVDRTYFNAWELIDGKIVINEDKKQQIINLEQAAIDSKNLAISKLAALGLTQEEMKAILS
jgi:hypothetical protein